MRFNVGFAVCAGGILFANSPAFAAYAVQPINAPGDFTPVSITDDGLVVGTLVTDAGSVAYVTDGTSSVTYDFCGSLGAADHTVITATPPYSISRYLAGACGYTSSFLYDVVHRMVIPIATTSSSGTPISAVGPHGTVAGIIDVHSGGDVAYYRRGGHYTNFVAGEFNVISGITLSGLIVGYSENLGGSGSAFTLQPGGVPMTVQPSSSGTGNYIGFLGGNRRGQLAAVVTDPNGSHAAMWQSGNFIYPNLPRGIVSSAALAINEAGDVAGTFRNRAGDTHVFVWHASSQLIDDIRAPDGATGFSVTAINNHAEIVGSYTLAKRIKAYKAVGRN